MNTRADLYEHLSNAEMREIAADVWREEVRRHVLSIGVETTISNLGYTMLWPIIDEVVGGNLDHLIAEKAADIVQNLTEFSVFRPDDRHNQSPAYRALQAAVIENKDALAARVAHHIRNLSKADALGIIKAGKVVISPRG